MNEGVVMGKREKKAVVLLSGGLDSATILAMAKTAGYMPYPLTFDYGQRHRVELDAAQNIALQTGIAPLKKMVLDLRSFGGSALTADLEVPKTSPSHTPEENIPITYVPARNTILLSFALGYAEVIGAVDIFIGANAVDYSGYPDCRPEFIAAFEALANLATAAGVQGQTMKIHAPLIHMTKAEIIQSGIRLGVDYGMTHSCYDPVGDKACGGCESCYLRAKGFADANVQDPTRYALRSPDLTTGNNG
jgi:7-cyano-7-deazaguanine synthase